MGIFIGDEDIEQIKRLIGGVLRTDGFLEAIRTCMKQDQTLCLEEGDISVYDTESGGLLNVVEQTEATYQEFFEEGFVTEQEDGQFIPTEKGLRFASLLNLICPDE